MSAESTGATADEDRSPPRPRSWRCASWRSAWRPGGSASGWPAWPARCAASATLAANSFGFEAINRGVVRATAGVGRGAARRRRPACSTGTSWRSSSGWSSSWPSWRSEEPDDVCNSTSRVDLAARCCPSWRRPSIYLAGPHQRPAAARRRRPRAGCRCSPLAATCVPLWFVGRGGAGQRPGRLCTVGAIALRMDGVGLLLAATVLAADARSSSVFSVPYMRGEEGEEKYYALLRRR